MNTEQEDKEFLLEEQRSDAYRARQTQFFLFEERRAIFSPSRSHRYRLKIVWRPDLPFINYIGLNPSIADETIDDKTVAKLKKFSKRWGFGGLIMSNLFAIVATDPDVMLASPEPVGKENDRWLRLNANECKTRVACWGNDGNYLQRNKTVMELLQGLQCFKLTAKGMPWHPLYLPDKTELQPFP